MVLRVKLFVGLMLVAAVLAVRWASGYSSHHWIRFAVYLAAVLLSSGFKVAMPKRDGTMSVNFPFILLGIVELSPGQAIAMAALSVAVQCRIKVLKPFTFVQIAFNIANVMVATAVACWSIVGTTRINMELAPALAVAAMAYFFANTIPVAFVIGWSSGQTPFNLWRREFPWYLPFYLVGAVLAAVAHLISLRFGWTTSLLLIPLIYTIYRAYQSQMATIADRQRHLDETEALQFRTIEGLAMAIEAKDQNTHDHLIRVRLYVSEIGKSFGLEELEMKALLTAAYLHDIGKLAVPEHIINKPGKLTQEEFEKMKIHPVVGADILERVRFPYPVVPIVRSHHEAWDGSGYPDGLKGEEIPIGARILTVIDCFDALASDRPYRKAMPLADAMALVRKNAGSQFDPSIVDVLERRYVELEEQARIQGVAIQPLKTDVSVWRGAAPGAGFEQDNAGVPSLRPAPVAGEAGRAEGKELATASMAMNLITAASQEAQAIFEMSQTPGSSLSPNETVSVMSSRLRRLIPFDCFALYLKTHDQLVTQYMDGEGARNFSPSAFLAIGEGLSGWVAQSGKPIVNGNPRVEPNLNPDKDSITPMGSALALPLLNLSGEIFGVLTLYSVLPNGFSKDHLRILQAVELKFSLSLQKALQLDSVKEDARLDLATQLPNMRQFFHGLEAELNKASRLDQKFGLIVCDLNAFEIVNDRLGHLTGNILLRKIAEGFLCCCRSYDVVARLGGDEFVFLLPGADDTSCSRQLEAIAAAVKGACSDLSVDLEVTASLGAAFYPRDGGTAEELLGVANRRMNVQKRSYYEVAEKQRRALALEVAAVA